MTAPEEAPTFASLGLSEPVLAAINEQGYTEPTPIQAGTIGPMLDGRDVLGQAQTGTGKTAAFALPILCRIDPSVEAPQALVLAPTRELAVQVCEAFQSYATHLRGVRILPVYGGTPFDKQLRELRRGAHIVVGTPGRVMDHMRRGSLSLDSLETFVLDEADEMLRMGFIDDVEWVLEHAPEERRIALFSATMPAPIRRIADRYLRDPVTVRIERETVTAATVRQRFRVVPHHYKVDVLARVLESEPYDGMLIFVRTRNGTTQLADQLEARGVAVAALNGDVPQRRREQLVDQLKSGRIDVLVATDVAARGLDVERLTHVVNYDPPHDAEAYVHRIGRTGRAGREGEAILFVTPRERHVVRSIERATNQRMEKLLLPTTDEVNEQRLEGFKRSIEAAIGDDSNAVYRDVVEELLNEGADPVQLACAVAMVAHRGRPLLLPHAPKWEREAIQYQQRHAHGDQRPQREPRGRDRGDAGPGRSDGGRAGGGPTEFFRVEVGYADGVKPSHLVGAIAGESGLDGRRIGRIDIRDDHTIVELPSGMTEGTFRQLSGAWVCGKQLQMTRSDDAPQTRGSGPNRGGPRRDDHRSSGGHGYGRGDRRSGHGRSGDYSDRQGGGRGDQRRGQGPGRGDQRASGGPDQRRPGGAPAKRRADRQGPPKAKKRGSTKQRPNKGRPKKHRKG